MKVFARSSSLLAATALLSLASLAPTTDATLDYGVKLKGINYDRRQAADWDPKQCKDANTVRADMKVLSEIATSVRIYDLDEKTNCYTADLLQAAKDNKMTVALGIWPGKSNMPEGLRKLENLLKAGAIDSNVVGIHVGSEAIYREDYGKGVSATIAIQYLNQVRDLLKRYNRTDVKLTIADVVDSYYMYPELIQAVDYVSINQFSFWEKKDARESMAYMLDRIRSIREQAAKLGKKVVISETGWSSGGIDPQGRTGETSLANQKKFFEDFYHQITAHGLEYYWFSAMDLNWIIDQKVPDTSPVEVYFGMFDQYKNLKSSFQNLDLKPRTRTTFQSVTGRLLAETYNPNKIEEVSGVEQIQESTDPLTQLRYQWFFDQQKGQIRSLNSDRCLDAYEPWNGGTVHTYMCVDSERNQKWTYDSSTRQLKHASHTGFCLDNDPAQNYKLQLWGCSDNNANQQWTIDGIAVTESPAVRFYAKESTSFAQLVRVGEEVAVGSGAAGAAGSEWLYDDATKTVQSKDSNYCLDAYEGWAGGRVHVWQCNAQEKNQRWSFDSTTGQFRHQTHTGFCLDRDPNGANGGLLQLWGCHLNNFNQVWRKVSSSAKAVQITGSDASVVEFFSRDKLQFTAQGGRDSQTWFYNSFSNTLLSKWGGECLDADKATENSVVHTWDCIAGEGNQKWKLENGLIKHQKHTGFCLAYNNAADKTPVLKTCSASDASQTFTLPAIKA